ncbi:MAG: hypothetical protein ACREEM_41405 [Blastocatellia bacterium]
MARLAGALAGATVNVAVNQKKGWLYLTINDARFERYETSIRKDADGSLLAYIHHAYAAPGQSGKGHGVRAFLRQVNAARRLGLKRFELFAAGYPRSTDENGYYVWARFGFDAPLGKREQARLPAPLKGVTTLSQLIQHGGQLWWKQHGNARSMNFDLADDSAMMSVFRDYLTEKGISGKE